MTSTALVVQNDLSRPVGAADGLSVTDKRLLALARRSMSPDEISEELGGLISPARAAQRVKEILRSHDWLSQEEQQGLLLLDMLELRDILMDHVRNEGGLIEDPRGGGTYYSFGDPRWSGNLIRLLGEMSKMIVAAKADTETIKVTLRRKHAAVMTQAIDVAFRMVARGVLERTHELDEQQMLDLLETALPRAIAVVEAHTDPEDT